MLDTSPADREINFEQMMPASHASPEVERCGGSSGGHRLDGRETWHAGRGASEIVWFCGVHKPL